MKNISQHANYNVQKLLVGNKADLGENRQTQKSEAGEVAEKHGCTYFETSAKTGDIINHI
jgi:putative ribosome biogenesis GTPase RsgA